MALAEALDRRAAFFLFEDALLESPGAWSGGAAFLLPGGALSGARLLADAFDKVEEASPGELPIARLGAAVLGRDGEAGGLVLEGHRGGNFVYILAAGAGGAGEFLSEIRLLQAEPREPRQFGCLKIRG